MVQKWTENKVLDKSWSKFIERSVVTPGKMYGLVKTPNIDNPVRVITSECETVLENLAILLKSIHFLMS